MRTTGREHTKPQLPRAIKRWKSTLTLPMRIIIWDLLIEKRETEELAEKEFALYEKLLKQEGEYIEIPKKPTSEDIEKFITLGDNYFKEGKLDEAIAEYKKALDINPRDDILNKLGQVHQQKRSAGKSEDTSPKIDTFKSTEALDKMPDLPREQIRQHRKLQ